MQYRHFGKLDLKPSLLGFGAMRLPTNSEDKGDINEGASIEMIRYAIDNGVNYVDTAYPYHEGRSEPLVAKALAGGYREKVYLASKSPTWLLEKPGDFTKYLDEQLDKLKTGHIDFYLQHAFDKDRFQKFQELKVYEEAMAAKAAGKITYFGFSFHDSYEVFETIINSYDWDFCQIQYNYLDTGYQAGTKGLQLAAAKNMGVVIMEPLRGGRLAGDMPEDLNQRFKDYPVKRSNVEWALRWVANHPEVSVILSGMSDMAQVKDNVAICSKVDILPDSMKPEELALIRDIADAWRKRILVNCTGCNYCMPCPQNIDIPGAFSIYNFSGSAESSAEHTAKAQYKDFMEAGKDAAQCIGCRQCIANCPQAIAIPDVLAALHENLS